MFPALLIPSFFQLPAVDAVHRDLAELLFGAVSPSQMLRALLGGSILVGDMLAAPIPVDDVPVGVLNHAAAAGALVAFVPLAPPVEEVILDDVMVDDADVSRWSYWGDSQL